MLYSLPSRLVQTSRRLDKALTTDTPNAVQTAGKPIVAGGELAARVQPGKNDFHAGQVLTRMVVHGHAPAIVGHRDRVILVQGHFQPVGRDR